MQDEQARLAELYRSDKRDDVAVSKTYGSISDLRKQMFENMLAAHKQLDGILTKEQGERVRRGGYGMWSY